MELTATGRNAVSEAIPDADHFTLIGDDVVDNEWVADHPAAARVVQLTLDAIDEAEGTPGRLND